MQTQFGNADVKAIATKIAALQKYTAITKTLTRRSQSALTGTVSRISARG